MRTISKLGILLGFFVIGVSIWRWTVLFDSPFRLVIGIFVAVSLMAWAYLIDWMLRTENDINYMKDEDIQNLSKRIDSLAQELRAMKELNNLK